MNTHSDSTTTPSAHLSTVNELLDKLDEMKSGRVGAQQRLDFMLEHGPRVVQDFNFRDAFDLEMEAMCARLKQVGDMDSSLRSFRSTWTAGPQDDDTKQAGHRLLDHLKQFIKQAQRQESASEIEMLERLWPWDWDVNAVFGLPVPKYIRDHQVWGGPTAKYAAARGDHHNEKATALEKVRDELAEEIANENLKELDMPSDEMLKKAHDSFVEGFHRGTEAAREDNSNLEKQKEISELIKEPKVRSHLAGAYNPEAAEMLRKKVAVPPTRAQERAIQEPKVVGSVTRGLSEPQVVGLVSSSERAPSSPQLEELEEELELLHIKTWTNSLNEELLSVWKFDRQLRGRIGDRARQGRTIIWKKGDEELRLDIERLGVDEVLVRLVPPRAQKGRWSLEEEQKRYRVVAEEMTTKELEELHQEPGVFVKKLLRK